MWITVLKACLCRVLCVDNCFEGISVQSTWCGQLLCRPVSVEYLVWTTALKAYLCCIFCLDNCFMLGRPVCVAYLVWISALKTCLSGLLCVDNCSEGLSVQSTWCGQLL